MRENTLHPHVPAEDPERLLTRAVLTIRKDGALLSVIWLTMWLRLKRMADTSQGRKLLRYLNRQRTTALFIR